MSAHYLALLGAMVVDSTNNTIRVNRSGTDYNVVIPNGVHYLRGGGFLSTLKTAFDAVVTGVTLSTSTAISLNIDPSLNPCGLTLITSLAVTWKFGDAVTTFDPTWLGFPATNTAAVTSIASSLTPIGNWVSNDVVKSHDVKPKFTAAFTQAASGKGTGVTRAAPMKKIMFELEMQDGLRMFVPDDGGTTTKNPLETWLGRHLAGHPFEAWWVTINSGTTLYNLSNGSTGTHYGRLHTAWQLDVIEEMQSDRLDTGLDLWSIDFTANGYVP